MIVQVVTVGEARLTARNLLHATTYSAQLDADIIVFDRAVGQSQHA